MHAILLTNRHSTVQYSADVLLHSTVLMHHVYCIRREGAYLSHQHGIYDGHHAG